MTIVYVVGEESEELRYSLRSLINYPHDNVVLVGDLPRFINTQHVHFIKGNRYPNKHRNTTDNIRLACLSDKVSDDFVLFNDDFFITAPVTPQNYHRGSVDDNYNKMPNDTYWQDARLTQALTGLQGMLSYDLHVPMIMNKQNYLDMLVLFKDEMKQQKRFHKRSVYGNLFIKDAEYMEDVKIKEALEHIKTPYVSSNHYSFNSGYLGQEIRYMFQEPSKYEK